MGQSNSRRCRPDSKSSSTPLNVEIAHLSNSGVETLGVVVADSQRQAVCSETPTQQVTRPGLPRQLTRLSSLIDPAGLGEGWKVKSPSGNLLGPNAFIDRPDRPLSVRERQERVRAALVSPNEANAEPSDSKVISEAPPGPAFKASSGATDFPITASPTARERTAGPWCCFKS